MSQRGLAFLVGPFSVGIDRFPYSLCDFEGPLSGYRPISLKFKMRGFEAYSESLHVWRSNGSRKTLLSGLNPFKTIEFKLARSLL